MRFVAGALALLLVTAQLPTTARAAPAAPFQQIPQASPLEPVAFSDNRITRLLTERGYYDISIRRGVPPIVIAEACSGSNRYLLRLNYWGDVLNRKSLGQCRSRPIVTVDATAGIRRSLLDRGFTRIRFIDSEPPAFNVEACRGSRKLNLVVDETGAIRARQIVGRCSLDDDIDTRPNIAIGGSEIQAVLYSRGFTDVRITDSRQSRYVAEGCMNGERIELVLNRFGEIRQQRTIGTCRVASADDFVQIDRTPRYTRSEIRRSKRVRPETCQTYFDSLLYENTILFDTGSARVNRGSYELIQDLAFVAGLCPEARIEVTGHTDSVGSYESNQRLSEDRAYAVASLLEEAGVPGDRLFAIGYGEERPVASNETASGRAQNRRIEFVVRWD